MMHFHSNIDFPLNIIFFGSSQQGKSSIIKSVLQYLNLPIPDTLKIGGNLVGETFETGSYEILYDDIYFNFFDTCGLNEESTGKVNPIKAFNNLKSLLKGLKNGVALLIYVKKKSSFNSLDENNLEIFRNLTNDYVPIWLYINDVVYEGDKYENDLSDNEEEEFRLNTFEYWKNYIENNENKKTLETKNYLKCILCGYNDSKSILSKTNLAKISRKCSCENILNKLKINNLQNIKIYENWSGYMQIIISTYNFFVDIIYRVRYLFGKEEEMKKEIFNKKLYSRKIYKAFIRLGAEESVAMKEAESFVNEIEMDILKKNT